MDFSAKNMITIVSKFRRSLFVYSQLLNINQITFLRGQQHGLENAFESASDRLFSTAVHPAWTIVEALGERWPAQVGVTLRASGAFTLQQVSHRATY